MVHSPSCDRCRLVRACAARRCPLVLVGAAFFAVRASACGFAALRPDRASRPCGTAAARPEIFLQFALGGFAAPHRFGDQLVGEHQPRVGDVLHRSSTFAICSRGGLSSVQTAWRRPRRRRACRETACGLHAAPSSRSSRDDRHSARNPSGAPAADRCPARKSPADRRARSDRRRRAPATARGDRLAIFDLHRAVRPLGHDLHGAAGFGRHLDPHQAIAHALQHRSGDRSNARADARLDNEPRLVEQIGVIGDLRFGLGQVQESRSYLAWRFRPRLFALRSRA